MRQPAPKNVQGAATIPLEAGWDRRSRGLAGGRHDPGRRRAWRGPFGLGRVGVLAAGPGDEQPEHQRDRVDEVTEPGRGREHEHGREPDHQPDGGRRDVPAATVRLVIGLSAMFVLAPSTRFGYFIYQAALVL